MLKLHTIDGGGIPVELDGEVITLRAANLETLVRMQRVFEKIDPDKMQAPSEYRQVFEKLVEAIVDLFPAEHQDKARKLDDISIMGIAQMIGEQFNDYLKELPKNPTGAAENSQQPAAPTATI